MASLTSLDVETLRTRLITKENQSLSATRGSLSKCAIKMREFDKATQAVEGETNDDTLKTLRIAAGEIIRELKLHDLEMKKLALGSRAADAELSHYGNLQIATEQSIESVRGEIDDLKQSYAEEIKRRQRIGEYETLAKMAGSRPPGKITKRKLQLIEGEMDEIKKETVKVQKKLDVKGKQFHLLIQSISDLNNGIEEDKLIAETIEEPSHEGDKEIPKV